MVTMISAAEVFAEKTVGVVLTGMGADGANGIRPLNSVVGRRLRRRAEFGGFWDAKMALQTAVWMWLPVWVRLQSEFWMPVMTARRLTCLFACVCLFLMHVCPN